MIDQGELFSKILLIRCFAEIFVIAKSVAGCDDFQTPFFAQVNNQLLLKRCKLIPVEPFLTRTQAPPAISAGVGSTDAFAGTGWGES